MNQISVPQAPAPDGPVPVHFTGQRSDFLGLVTRGAFLELVTLGFYRFWLVTDIRRHLWSHTVVDGDGPEYTGRGKELLIGFLVAMAILLPIYLAYFLLSLEAERYQAFASTPLVAFLYVFGQFAIYRARRYRLSRTVWRGVRFWMTGSGWVYSLKASLWGLAVAFTLGLLLPWRDAALERYKMQHSHYGDLQGSFEGTGGQFFKRAWWLWPLAFIALPLFPLAPFVYAKFKALQWQWWLSGVRFGGVSFKSEVTTGGFAKIYWKVIGWLLLLSVAFSGFMAIAIVLISSMKGTSMQDTMSDPAFYQSIPFLAATILGYLLAILAANIVLRVYLTRDIWAHVASSVAVHGIGAANDVAAKGNLASALGEGFADGLDVGGF